MTNEQILARLDQAFKEVTVADLGQSVLAPEKFDRFIRAMQHRTTILPEARFMQMDSHVEDIDRIGFVGRVLTAGVDQNENVRGNEASVATVTATNRLVAKELRALTGIRDRALRRNIERGQFENTLVDLFGEAAGRDIEEWSVFADVTVNPAVDPILSLTDGWARKAGNAVYGQVGVNPADFDPNDAEEVFDALITAIPKQYLVNRSEWRIYCTYELEDGYRNILKARGTALGDMAQTSDGNLLYKGFPVVYAPMLERSRAVGAGGAGRIAMLQHPDNMVWGVFHEVTIEREREAKLRRTDFVLTIEADCHYEDENAAVVAYLDQARP